MDWKVGDIAICIDVSGHPILRKPPLILYQEYTVLGIKECSCGMILLDVGLHMDSGDVICNCGDVVSDKDGPWWIRSTRFTKRLPISAIDALISEIMEKSPPEEIEEKSEETTKV